MRRALPEIVYLFASFFRRKAAKFRAISENGTLFRRVTLTTALAVFCGIATYLVLKLDPFDGIEGFMGAPERAQWAALVPLIGAMLMYLLLRRYADQPMLATFLNLGLVMSTALTVIPGVLIYAGVNASALGTDIRNLRAGRGAGTPVHAVLCGSIETRAAIEAVVRTEDRIQLRLTEHMRALLTNQREVLRNQGDLAAATRRLTAARERDIEAEQAFEAAMDRGLGLMERGLAINDRQLRLQRRALDVADRYIDLQYWQTNAPVRLLRSYPVATTFLAIAAVAGLLIWLFAAVIIWRLIATPQETRRRRILAKTTIVVMFLFIAVSSGMLRSGVLEALVQELPSRAMLFAQLRAQFDAATPMCGRINNYGLW